VILSYPVEELAPDFQLEAVKLREIFAAKFPAQTGVDLFL
jgi:hypothetical protein